MDITFKGTRYEPTPEILAQVGKQLRAVEKFIDESRSKALASVELGEAVGNQRKGDIWRAEITIDHEGAQYRAESMKAKLDHAITTAVRDISGEVRRAGKKAKDAKRKGGSIVKSFLQGWGK